MIIVKFENGHFNDYTIWMQLDQPLRTLKPVVAEPVRYATLKNMGLIRSVVNANSSVIYEIVEPSDATDDPQNEVK